jgi:hypothetical protein
MATGKTRRSRAPATVLPQLKGLLQPRFHRFNDARMSRVVGARGALADEHGPDGLRVGRIHGHLRKLRADAVLIQLSNVPYLLSGSLESRR